MEKVQCNLCSSGRYKSHLRVAVDGRYIDIVKCLNCGLVYQNPRLTAKEISEMYSHHYFKSDYFDKDNQMRIYRNAGTLIDQLAGYCDRGKFLDIGASGGAYVKAARDRDWEANGIEPSSWGVSFARDFWGVDLMHGTAEEIQIPGGSVDMAVLIHTLEHFPSPLQTLERIRGFLKETGILFISVPNIASYKAKKHKGEWWALKPVEHLFFFSRKTLKCLLEKAGFTVVKMYTSNPVMSLEELRKMGLPVKEGLRTFINRHLSIPKDAVRHLMGRIIQGEGIEVIARRKRGNG